MNPKWTREHQHPNKYHQSWQYTTGRRFKLPHVYRNQYAHLHETCKVQFTNSKCQQSSCKRFWTCHHKNTKNNYYTTLVIILNSTKLTKHNKSRRTQTLQTMHKGHNLGGNMVKNCNIYGKENQSWNWSQRKRPATIRIHYNCDI